MSTPPGGTGPPPGQPDNVDADDGDPDDVDPDVGSRDAQHEPVEPAVVGVVAVGGVLGAWARYGLDVALPHAAPSFPWSTLLINASGCLLISLVVGSLRRRPDPPRLARPFLATGVLGGYTTFSTFAVDAVTLLRAGRVGIAAGYVGLTLVVCAAAVWLGDVVLERVGGRPR